MSLSEKRYQLAAHKRNITDQKLSYYNQTAKYFERESQKAKQFNTWNVEVKSIRWDNIKKTETLNSRRNKLKVLLKSEDEEYKRECDKLKSHKIKTKDEISLEVFKDKLKEKRAELSLYNPNTHRRLKSYFTDPVETERYDSKELTEPITRNLSRFSFDNNNYLNKRISNSPFNNNYNYKKKSAMEFSNEQNELNEKAFDERAIAFNENRTKSLSDHMDYENFGKNVNFIPDRKYTERYAHRSLANTNVFDTAGHSNDSYEKQNNDDETSVMDTSIENLNGKNIANESSGDDVIDFNSTNKTVNQEEFGDFEGLINSSKKVDDTFEKQDKIMSDYSVKEETTIDNSSDMMVLYLTHNDLKKKINDLEVREHRACMKHLWEETLRLRDMRNRLELLREKKIYQRDDLQIDEANKQVALKNIERRSIQLKEREDTCADSNMYSEDAKRIWNKWVEEDKNSPITEGDHLRESLMKQLEDEWHRLSESDQKIISQTYADVMSNASLQKELEILAKKGFH